MSNVFTYQYQNGKGRHDLDRLSKKYIFKVEYEEESMTNNLKHPVMHKCRVLIDGEIKVKENFESTTKKNAKEAAAKATLLRLLAENDGWDLENQ